MDLVRLNRGQLVLAAAAVVAIALAPILFAYLQLGYHPDAASPAEPETPGETAAAYLDRAVHEATAETAGEYEWAEREAAADAIRDALDPDLETLATSRVEEGIVYEVDYDTDAAAERLEQCTTGDGRRFGPCRADEGIVLQKRADEAVLVAVAFEVTVVTPDTRAELTVVIEVGTGTTQ